MTHVYLASPNTQQQAEHAEGMNVLLSFASFSPWLDRYQASFDRLLIDSGAYSELNSKKKIDGQAYAEWHPRWSGRAEAVAGLDDISGDWRRSLQNYEKFGGFPTMHEADPPGLLADLIPLARERGGWIGLGLTPPRQGKERWVRWACENVPDDLHVHGWALRAYLNVTRLDSVDSTNWWRDGMNLATKLPWLTYGECLGLVIKRYQREPKRLEGPKSTERGLF